MREYKDYYFKKAKTENYPARSVYKLQELDSRFHVLKKGYKILDLGASPGSWTLAASQKIGSSGNIVACDLKDLTIDVPENVIFFKNDIFNMSESFLEKLKNYAPYDLVMSDMAPATTGSKLTDQARSMELALRAHELAKEFLRKGGNFIVKIFMGPDSNNLLKDIRTFFNTARSFKPKSSRSESKEMFFLGLNYK